MTNEQNNHYSINSILHVLKNIAIFLKRAWKSLKHSELIVLADGFSTQQLHFADDKNSNILFDLKALRFFYQFLLM